MIKADKEVKALLKRFMIAPCRLKNSPEYEKRMVIDKGFEELSRESFLNLIDLAYPEEVRFCETR